MRKVLVSAPAKVNLALRVGPPRLDGFHPLETVFEALDVYDDVLASLPVPDKLDSVTLTITGLGEDLPTDGTNLAVRAAELLPVAVLDLPGGNGEIRRQALFAL